MIGIKKISYCYYFDDIININDLELDNVLIDEKSYENILFCEFTYKTPYSAKFLCITFDKDDEYARKYYKTSYLKLFYSEKFKVIFGRIRYLIRLKSNTPYVVSHDMKIGIDSDHDLKQKDMHCVVIHIQFVFNKNHNH